MISLIILGIVQGLTEFLPVSSSGHLLFLQNLTKISGSNNLFIDVFLHSATFLVIIVYYIKDIWRVLKNIFAHPFNLENHWTKLGWVIIVGNIPTVILGLIIERYFKNVFQEVNILFITWAITALFLIYSDRLKNFGRGLNDIKFSDSLIIGTVQGIAIFPGISRSGSTIIASLFLGIERESAAKFSFLLGLPAMFGAILLELKDAGNINIGFNFVWIWVVTFVFGFVGLFLLLKLLKNAKFKYFGIYLLLLIALLTTLKFFNIV